MVPPQDVWSKNKSKITYINKYNVYENPGND